MFPVSCSASRERVIARAAQASERARRELAILYRLLKHPETPWTIRAIATVAVGYVVSPVQLIPSFIPVIGQLDDVCVLFVASRAIRMLVDPALLAQCVEADTPPPSLKLLAGVAVAGSLIVALSARMM